MIIAYNVQKNSHNDGYLWNARPTRQALWTRVPKMFFIIFCQVFWSSEGNLPFKLNFEKSLLHPPYQWKCNGSKFLSTYVSIDIMGEMGISIPLLNVSFEDEFYFKFQKNEP